MSALKRVKEYALSDADIRKVLGNDIQIWNYPQLKGLSNIDEMFDRKGRAILLFPNSGPYSGHWTCLIRKPRQIEFFDSYGEPPEEQKDGLPQSKLEQYDIDTPELTRLLRGSSVPVYYNTHQFQSNNMDVASCGRHCIVRLFYAPYSLNKYKSVIDKSGMSADDFVSALVYNYLKR
jgi:hypothetical protein